MKKSLAVAFGLLLVLSGAAFAQNQTQWNKKHPRRAQVNGRLKNQDKRIKAGVKDGQLSKKQARQLHRRDQAKRAEERRMASRDGGHISKADQAKLDRQENRESHRIYNERHDGAPANSSAQTPAAPTGGR